MLTPLSVVGQCRQYREALPAASAELCGATGVYVAVGYPDDYLVYRGTFDSRANQGNWNWACAVSR